ncbi:hypothetical protein GCM10022252_75720 [Streptosporangium oxazolinicum]|uniref:Uncharacterized protein n=1 Tax=Streptosporangium oxazolinicum TaxID=909287 RepID=A0ABP8BKR1_9ACTN
MTGLPDYELTVEPVGGIDITLTPPGGHQLVIEQTGDVELTIAVPGIQGPPGPPGPGGGGFHTHTQTTAARVWTIVHALGRRPGVAVEDEDGNELDAGVSCPNNHTVIVTFGPATAGRAHLS